MILLALDMDTASLDCGGIETIGEDPLKALPAVDELLRLNGAGEKLGEFGGVVILENGLEGGVLVTLLDKSLVEEDVVNEVPAVVEGGDALDVEATLVDFRAWVVLKESCDGAVTLPAKVGNTGEAEDEAKEGALEKVRKEGQLTAVVRNRDLSTIALNRAGNQRQSRNAYCQETSATRERNYLGAVQRIRRKAHQSQLQTSQFRHQRHRSSRRLIHQLPRRM